MMKIKFLSAILFITCTSTIFAQENNWLWAKSATATTGFGEGYSVSADAAGNVFVAGYFTSPTITFGTNMLTNLGAADIFIAKYDPSGNVLWAKSIGGAGTDYGISISADTAGNVFMTGYFSSDTLTFGSDTLANADPSGNTFDIFIAKYAANGNVLWAKRAGNKKLDEAYSVCAVDSGNVFVTGYFSCDTLTFGSDTLINADPSGNNYDIFIAKYAANGNVLWAKRAGNTNWDAAYSVSADSAGNAFVTGYFKSPTIIFGNDTLTNAQPSGFGSELFLAKYDANGNVLWAKSGFGTDQDFGNAVSADPSGNVFVTGGFGSHSITLGSITLVNADSLGNSWDAFIAKYDANGNVLWANSEGGKNYDLGYSISADVDGNVFVSGGFYSDTIIFETDSLMPLPASTDPMFVVKYDANGNVLCLSSLASGGDDFSSICVDHFGNAYVGGDFYTNHFGVGSDTLTLTGFEDVFVAKFKANCGMEAIAEINVEENFSIYPNPFSSSATIQFNSTPTNAELNIYNLYGQEIKTIKNISADKIEIDRDNLASGIYFVRLVEGNKLIGTGKVIIAD